MGRQLKLTLAVALAATLAIAGHLANELWLVYIFKPLATGLILSMALGNAAKTKLPFARWVALGLFFSLWGDVLLIWPDKWFLPGLAVFLLAHVVYLIALTRDVKFPASALVWLALLAVAAVNFFALQPHLPRGLKLPVAIYALAVATMAGQAAGRALVLRTAATKLAAIGALLFLFSDTLLAWSRFQQSIPLAPLLILGPYYAAQLLIALSTTPRPASS